MKDARAFWLDRKTFLQKRFCYRDKFGVKPWLQSIESDNRPLLIGCVVCAKAKVGGPMAQFQVATVETLRVSKLRRHSDSRGHVRALAEISGVCVAVHAPTTGQIQSVWQRAAKLEAVPKTEPFTGKDSKERQIIYCIAEAIRVTQRSHLKAAECIALSQDGAEGRHLIRYACCGNDFTVRTGILGSYNRNWAVRTKQ